MEVVVAIVLLAVGLVLFMPLSFDASGAVGDESVRAEAEARWGPGLAALRFHSDVGVVVSVAGMPVARMTKLPTLRSETKRRQRRRSVSSTGLFRMAGSDKRGFCRMLRRAIAALHPRLHVHGTLGLEDPFHTAMALVAAQRWNVVTNDRAHLDLRDDFLDETTQLFGRIRGWLVPAELIWVVAGWAVRSDGRRVRRGS